MNDEQRERLRKIATNPKSWPAVRDHARLCLTIEEKRIRRRAADIVKGFGFLIVLCLLAMLAEGVGR